MWNFWKKVFSKKKSNSNLIVNTVNDVLGWTVDIDSSRCPRMNICTYVPLSFWSIYTLLLPKRVYIDQNDKRVYKSTKTSLTVHTVCENLYYMHYVVLNSFFMNSTEFLMSHNSQVYLIFYILSNLKNTWKLTTN